MIKKIIHWTSRIITISFPIVVFLSTAIESVSFGFNLKGFLMLSALVAFLSALAWASWKWSLFGAILFTILSAIVIYSASRTSIGIDWVGVFSAGFPMFLAGILFLIDFRLNKKVIQS